MKGARVVPLRAAPAKDDAGGEIARLRAENAALRAVAREAIATANTAIEVLAGQRDEAIRECDEARWLLALERRRNRQREDSLEPAACYVAEYSELLEERKGIRERRREHSADASEAKAARDAEIDAKLAAEARALKASNPRLSAEAIARKLRGKRITLHDERTVEVRPSRDRVRRLLR